MKGAIKAERILHYLYLLRLRGELRVPEQLVLWIRDAARVSDLYAEKSGRAGE